MRREALPDLGESWSLFWEEQGPEGRCLTTDDVFSALREEWLAFAANLPPSARVLDLACGAGIVGRTLLSRRVELQIVGVDCATVPRPAHPRLELLSLTRVEALPFTDNSFDAATSQFGIEYGNAEQAASELVRVLKPAARFCFLVHHRDSDIVRDGATRRNAMRASCSAPVKAAFVSGDPSALDRQRKRLLNAYPGEPLVELVCIYLHRRIGHTRSDRHRLWDAMTAILAPELAMLTELERRAKSSAELGQWLAPFLSRMSNLGVSVVRAGSGRPIAWKVEGVR